MWSNPLETKALDYAASRNLELGSQLGDGFDGSVWEVQSKTNGNGWAAKFHRNLLRYTTEKTCYLRLESENVSDVRGLNIPLLLRADDSWRVIEMTIVKPPFLLDFASAFLDARPDFSEDIIGLWHADLEERYGERVGDVLLAIKDFERMGIFLTDIHPGNLRLS